MGATRSVIDGMTVAVLSHAADAATAREAVAAAHSCGYKIVMPKVESSHVTPVPSICVIVLSRRAVEDRAYLEYAGRVASASPVVFPVRVDDVKPEFAGEIIDAYNCADFSNIPVSAGPRRWMDLFHTNVSLYSAFNDVSDRAGRWADNGRTDDYLLQDVVQVRDADAMMQAMTGDSFSRPSAVMWDYVRASQRLAVAERRRVIWQRCRILLAVIVVVAIMIWGSLAVSRYDRAATAARQTSFGAAAAVSLPYHAFRGIQTAEGIDGDASSLIRSIAEDLGRPWPRAWFGSEDYQDGTWQRYGRLSADGTRYYVESANGEVQLWDTMTSQPVGSHAVAQGRFVFDVDEDGRHLAVADGSGVGIVDTSTWERHAITGDAGSESTMIAVAKQADAVLYANDGRLTLWTSADDSDGTVTSQEYDDVLAVRRTDDGLRALVTSGGELLVVDPGAMTPIARYPLPTGDIVVGAINAAGTVIVAVNGVLYSPHGDDGLQPVGYTTRDAPKALELTDQGIIVSVTSGDGVALFDMRSRANLGTACSSLTTTNYLSVSSDGLIACTSGWLTEIWSSADFAPSSDEPKTTVLSTSAEMDNGDASIAVTPEGQVTVHRDGAEYRGAMPDSLGDFGDITAAAVSSDGVSAVAGSSTGRVIAWDMDFSGDGMAVTVVQDWRTPDGAPVDAVGWADPDTRLAVRGVSGVEGGDGGALWWTPFSCKDCSTLIGVTNTASDRAPACWQSTALEAFGDTFRTAHDMAVCRPITDVR